jgi:hypothetical protein
MRSVALFIFILTGTTSYSQGIKGRLTDNKNNPVPFAAVYDEVTYSGTTSNAEGYYELKLAPGKHSIVYKSLGYYVERRNIEVGKGFQVLNLQLSEQAYELKNVVVTPGKEDPAYAIMRKVIGLAPFHLHQVKEYTADVYLRGSIHIIKMPKFISKRIEVNGKKGVIKSGDMYMEESLNQIDFTAPDSYKQKVKSFRTNFPGENSVNPMQIVRSSFYHPKIGDAISPLAPNAFSLYKYRYEGYSKDGEFTIFKIKVIPKRNSQQLLNGYLYIIDQLWCLHSLDMSQEMFFGKIDYKGIFSPVKGEAWLPISYNFYVNAGIMGIKGEFKYTSSVKYQKVLLNDKKAVKPVKVEDEKETPEIPVKKIDPKKQKRQEEIERLMAKENMNNRDMVKLSGLMAKEAPQDTATTKSLELKPWNNTKVEIEKDAMKKDTSYWNTVRPIPLTSIETGLSDSIKLQKKDTIVKKDTAVRKENKTLKKIGNFAFGGAGFNMLDSSTHVNYNGLIGVKNFGFNTVDGFVFKQSIGVRIQIDSIRQLKIDPGVAYAFSRQSFMWWAKANFEYDPLRGGNLIVSYEKSSKDYSSNYPMSDELNALTSLFLRKNYKKFYETHHIEVSNSIDIINGMKFTAQVGYSQEQLLLNHSNYSFFYGKERDYSPNVPEIDHNALQDNLNNTEAYFNLHLEYTPQYYYRIWKGRKRYSHSKYPTFYAGYKKAVPGVLNSSANYDFLELGARQTKEWGMMHSFNWNVTAGKYFNRNKMFLSDYRFFNNQPLSVMFTKADNSFFLPTIYANATNDRFVEGHVTFTTPYLLIKYLPFLSNKIWLENLHLNYLYTPQNGHYWETGYSISQIYALGGIGIYAGFNGAKYSSVGVKVTLAFD